MKHQTNTTFLVHCTGEPAGAHWYIDAKDEKDALRQMAKLYKMKPSDFQIAEKPKQVKLT